jgi:uncharacterized DUF497 family protein
MGEANFVWDTDKAFGNVRKHGISFSEAAEAFFDPFLVFLGDEAEEGEVRETVIGLTRSWRLSVVVFTYRAEAIRVISARNATNVERRRYEEQ